MQRTILFTTVQDENGATHDIIGKFDVKTLAKRKLRIVYQSQALYTMTDEDFVKYGTKKKEDKI